MSVLGEAFEGDREAQLIAIRDYIISQLEGEKCKACQQSQLRAGEQTALIKLLREVTLELEGIRVKQSKKSDLSRIRGGMGNVTNITDAAGRRHPGSERNSATGDRRRA